MDVFVKAEDAGQRADKFIFKFLNKPPKSLVYKFIRKKRIKLNGARLTGAEILKPDDRLSFYVPIKTPEIETPEKNSVVTDKRIVIYQDENVLIINKPAGIESQTELNNITEGFICNRLDRNTSGIIYAGKNYRALRALNEAQTRKTYLAVAEGKIAGRGIICDNLKKDPYKNKVFSSPEGKNAVTEYKSLKIFGGSTLLEVRIQTGRTHQIRAGLAKIGFPLAGDAKYGSAKKYKRFFLHSFKLKFVKCGLKYLEGMEFCAPPPIEWEEICKL
jgi:23S rRNA pseudouridine955/2504/2580 synthase